MKIAPSSEAYCEENKIVVSSESIEKGKCHCCKCEHLIIRKKKRTERVTIK